jgi:hypothetical protein
VHFLDDLRVCTHKIPHSPDNELSFGRGLRDSDSSDQASYPGSSEATMAHPRGESGSDAVWMDFDRRLMLQFRGSLVTSDADTSLRH